MADLTLGGINWELVVKFAGAATPLVGWMAGQVGIRMGRRAALKADLEIWTKIKDAGQKKLVEERIQSTVNKLYGVSRFEVLLSPALIAAIVWTAGFAYWTVAILFDKDWAFEWSWWALATGYMAALPTPFILASVLLPEAEVRGKLLGGAGGDAPAADPEPAKET